MSSEFPSLRGEKRPNRAVINTTTETRPQSDRTYHTATRTSQPRASQPDWLVTFLKGRVRERARV